MSKPAYVLFYTLNNCKYCRTFITRLKSKPDLFKMFNLVDIDKLPDLPDEVDEVPCVYDGKNIFKGDQAFKWLSEKSLEFLAPADNSLQYTFINGEEESLFNNFSLLEQKNGSFGMDNVKTDSSPAGKSGNKNMSMESLMNLRSNELK